MATDHSRETVEFFPEFAAADEQFLRHIFIRAQMTEFVKDPLLMVRADDVF